MGKYFQRMPVVNYEGSLVRNIMTRVKILDSVDKEVTAFYPYTMKEGDRPDTIAYDYYGDAQYDWLVYLSNRIVDPYYELPMNQEDLEDFIIKKYGSLEKAVETILFYRNDYTSDDSKITPPAYEALPDVLKKYWTASTDQYDMVNGYTRIQEDWNMTTNKIVALAVSTDDVLIVGEKVANNGASGYVQFSNTTQILVHHVTGNFEANTRVVSSESNNVTMVLDVKTVADSFDPDEAHYWSPVNAYDYEVEQNNSKKEIKLLDKKYLSVVDSDMQRLMDT